MTGTASPFPPRRVVLLVMAGWLVFSFTFFTRSPYRSLVERAGGQLAEQRFGYGTDSVREQLDALGEDGRAAYRRFQLMDHANALATAAAFTVALAYVLTRLTRARSPVRHLVWFPALMAAAELTENSLLFSLAGRYPDLSDGLVGAASFATRVKFVTGPPVMFATAIAIVVLGIRGMQNRRRQPI